MKKNRLAGLLLLAPVALLCACTSATTLSFSANWYKNTMTTHPSNTLEKLEYSVTFTAPTSSTNISVEYDDGTYVTELKNETVTLADGSTKEGYVYTTELAITGRYTVNGTTGDTFEDYVKSVVKFLPVEDKLRPVESVKTVHTTSAVTASPSDTATVESATCVYSYTYEVKYDNTQETATVSYTDLTTEEPTAKVSEIKISGDSTYLDNEEIAFALRGLNLSSSASFRSINPSYSSVWEVTVTPTAIDDYFVDFEMDGTRVSQGIKVYSAEVVYNANRKGMAQKAIYAATTDASNNTYRNVMVGMEVPIFWSLGTLNYSLVKAEFSTK